MRSKIFNALTISALAVVLSVGLGYVYATGPSCAAPGCNAAAPLNVSGTMQEKKNVNAAGATITSVKLLDKDNGVTGFTTNISAAGVFGNGGLQGVVGGTSQVGGTGVLGTGVSYGVTGIGDLADFYAKSTGVRFADGYQQKTAVTWKMCEGSNGTTYNEAFMVPPSWGRTDCFYELLQHLGGGMAWWRVGCLDPVTKTGSWGGAGGTLPANNSCGWDAPPPPPPDLDPRPRLFCWKYPDALECQ